jgi:hypothetical protein
MIFSHESHVTFREKFKLWLEKHPWFAWVLTVSHVLFMIAGCSIVVLLEISTKNLTFVWVFIALWFILQGITWEYFNV